MSQYHVRDVCLRSSVEMHASDGVCKRACYRVWWQVSLRLLGTDHGRARRAGRCAGRGGVCWTRRRGGVLDAADR